MEVLNYAEKNKSVGIRGLAEIFECGKTQISCILKSRESITEMYEANLSNDTLKSSKRSRTSEYADINEALHKWFTLAHSRNIFPDGSQLREKARQIAEQLGYHTTVNDDSGDDLGSDTGSKKFQGSNGWLDRWKRRYNIRQITVSGESGDVSGVTVDSWKE